MKDWIRNHVKNAFGWRTGRKLVVLSVDDYGVVRTASREALDRMVLKGLKVQSRFDAYDALETEEDLEMLFDVLTSVKDQNRNHAVLTPFAVPCNINFEQMKKEGYARYVSELLSVTYEKLSTLDSAAYSNAWGLWQEGQAKKLLCPQFHGREHLNLKIFEDKLRRKERELITALENRSYSCNASSLSPNISYTAAFKFDNFTENHHFQEVVRTGLEAFETVYGYRAQNFNAPGGVESQAIHRSLYEGGIRFLDTPLIKLEHQGSGKYKRKINYTGKTNPLGQIFLVRNVVFEPTDARGVNWLSGPLQQIGAAFRLRRPAIISSHRVNFSGYIDPKNRKIGLTALRKLLQQVVKKWPDVEFVGAHELGQIIESSRQK
ncbi:MAG: hypothetical protein OEQ39_29035 [Gammaproteobacteria bacterium]|nr:hypothetical protein [Gammaproteobacteria bacterium]